MSTPNSSFPLRAKQTARTLFAGCVLLTAFSSGFAKEPAATPAPSAAPTPSSVINIWDIAKSHYGEDAAWYVMDIPFLDIDDPEIQQVYYYRWQLFRAHIRELGTQGIGITEFLPPVPWARHPYEDLNDSSPFHLREGRWLRDPRLMASLIDHLYAGGGNDRHFSEGIAAATLAWTQVTGNTAPALRNLAAMEHIYSLWDDHFSPTRYLYWIEPILDATEYTVSSIDASGAGYTDTPNPRDNGFNKGFAYRPSINSYQFGNASAIATFAQLANQPAVAADFTERAETLRAATLGQLWNPDLKHFSDVYQRSTNTVYEGTFVRNRELVGLVPWMYELPPTSPSPVQPNYSVAWTHALSPDSLGGPSGLRTAEKNYPRYLAQYRYDKPTGLPECQWNGPSWPFQTSQVLTGLANLLDDYPRQSDITADDYIHLLRQYTHEHLQENGPPDLVEDYNPDTGAPIVKLSRSHHYNHSTYNDLILSGLIGIRPRLDDKLELKPLIPTNGSRERVIHYFSVQDIVYHGHSLSITYDADGTRYHIGAGLSIFCDDQLIYGPAPLGPVLIPFFPGKTEGPDDFWPLQPDLAVNVWGRVPATYEPDLPIARASSELAGADAYQAIDGRSWFFPEIPNGWTPTPASPDSWLSIDLRKPKTIASVELNFFSDGTKFKAPAKLQLQYMAGEDWKDIPAQQPATITPIANGSQLIKFTPISTQQIRITLHAQDGTNIRLPEIKVFAPADIGKP